MNQEKEFAPFLKDFIKDADTEKKIRELHEKADGLDVVKPKFIETRQQLQQVQAQHQNVLSSIEELRSHVTRGDFDSFFKRLSIPEEKILQWMHDKLTYNDLPPEQRQVLDARKSAEQRAWEAESRLQQLESKYSETVGSAKVNALETALQMPETTQFAQVYEARFGEGSFRDAVIDQGDLALTRSGGKTDLTPQQAVQKVMAQHAYLAQLGQQPAAAEAQPGAQPPVGKQKAVPVIPNVGGKSSSPTKTQVKSLDDIRKLANSM